MTGENPAAAAFYFDLASPLAYLAAERALRVLPGPAEWRPVLAADLPRSDRFEAFRCEADADAFRESVVTRARELGLQPLRWPEPFPFDSVLAMRVATYAKSIGRAVPFALAAFRQAFAGGHCLEDPDFVLIAAAACEMHPTAVLRAAESERVARQLRESGERACALGVGDVPAVALEGSDGARVFEGERELEAAALAMGAA